ncbi:cupin domain-containing protein [Roseateles amylovorans]|uniref:Cupin domain-containing protein n=1 Tax=Roseateles amylovorans TaxID=2978473 RepID=A0ABY6AXA1_9BURK|nr:cupin domain-containing protein [Roseateles amylovorans]UXH76476.1 cupin domain-containing protein [Roseateles amylovorans]
MAQTLSTLPSEPAPGRGVIPHISSHLAAMPSFFELDKQPMEQVTPLIFRQYVHGTEGSIVKWTFKKGAVVPLHHQPHEQLTWITQGRCEVFSQGRKFVMTAGTFMLFPPNVPHEFHCTEDTVNIDFFAPRRQDWIDGVQPPSAQASAQAAAQAQAEKRP